MSEKKPININMNTIRTGLAGRGALAVMQVSADFEFVDLEANEIMNVEGLKLLRAFNFTGGAAAVEGTYAQNAGFLPLSTEAGTVSIAAGEALLVDVTGVSYIRFDVVMTIVVGS